MVIAGVSLDHTVLKDITADFLDLKRQFFPRKFAGLAYPLDAMLTEIKGADVRRALRGSSRQRQQAQGFLQKTLDLLTTYEARLIGRVWIKELGVGLDPRASYCFALQDIAEHFDHQLATTSQIGLVMCDSRQHNLDSQACHSLFTRKHAVAGDRYPHLVEAMCFGQSTNHVGLQLADLVSAALIFPMAASAYCPGHITTLSEGHRFDEARIRFGPRVKAIRYVYRDHAGKVRGGIVVSDKLGHKASSHLFP
jgi:hypothetical protein